MYRTFILFLLALLSLSAPAGASVIYVSGDQTGTWAADTVIVTAEVRVPPGQSLTILPGVEVLFSVYCKLIVDNGATLWAVGTVADSIRFDVLPPNTTWHGIRFLSASDSSRLEYCILTHGHATGVGEDTKGGAIYCYYSDPTISHNTISENVAQTGGGIYCYGGMPTISDNTISGNSSESSGGGIYCENNSSPIISGNTLSGNSALASGGGISCLALSSPSISNNAISGNSAWYGGAIYCWSSSPTISGNSISGNSADWGGGICCYTNSSPSIGGNTISDNTAGNYAGGIYCNDSSPSISNNTVSGNLAGCCGGIFCGNSSPTISGNNISRNSAFSCGGICCWNNSSPIISGNIISRNRREGAGGGIDCRDSSPSIIGNTISGNQSNGFWCDGGSPTLVNCILWGNSVQQIYVWSGSPQVNYSDIQGGYAGTGNINTWPAFVDTAQGDYRLQWGSPCIDTGDPNPIYNDPDGSRADMGAWYYDQSLPVRVLLTPYNAPIQIPASGGSFQYAIQATNIESATLSALVWCDATMPSGSTTGALLGPVTISLASGQTLSRVRTQVVPAGAPAGMYHYNAYAVAVGDTSTDSFTFVKLGAGDWSLAAGDWTNTGESFEGQEKAVLIHPSSFRLHPSHPNPFNPTTAISFELRDASYVSLRIYDSAGRLVAELVNGWRQAGVHDVTFDGSDLPSGIYFAKLKAGDYSQVQKLVLLK